MMLHVAVHNIYIYINIYTHTYTHTLVETNVHVQSGTDDYSIAILKCICHYFFIRCEKQTIKGKCRQKPREISKNQSLHKN